MRVAETLKPSCLSTASAEHRHYTETALSQERVLRGHPKRLREGLVVKRATCDAQRPPKSLLTLGTRLYAYSQLALPTIR